MKPKSEKIRQSILTATTELIVNEGLTAISTVKVAQAVGTPQSNIYSYYKNKKALLLAVFSYHQEKLIDALRSTIDEELSPKEKLHTLVASFLQLNEISPNTIRIILLFRQQPEWRVDLPKIGDSTFFTTLFEQLTHLQQQGIIKQHDTQFLAECVFTIITNYITATASGELNSGTMSKHELMTIIDNFMLTTAEQN